MSTLIVSQPVADLKIVSTEELKNRLIEILGRSANDLLEMAMLVGELEARGEDLHSLRLGITDYLRKIAAGQLLPALVVRLSHNHRLLTLAARLPIPDQQRIVDGTGFDLATWRGERIEWRKVDPTDLTAPQVRQLFASDRIRTRPEQVAYLETTTAVIKQAIKKPTKGKARINGRGQVVLNRKAYEPAQLIQILGSLSPNEESDTSDRTSSLAVKFTPDELANIKTRADAGNCKPQDVVRNALRAVGII